MLWEITCEGLRRADGANSNLLSNSLPHQTASGRRGRSTWVLGGQTFCWPLNSHPKIKGPVLLLTCCVTVSELQFSVSGLCNVNDVTILTSISWESGVTHSRSGTVVAHSSLLGCLGEGRHERPLTAMGKGQSCFSPAVWLPAYVIFTAAFSRQGTFPGGYVPAEPQSS